MNGNFETLYELEGEDGATEWAYAPYLTSVPYASGPQVNHLSTFDT